ncbi:MAG: JAB domain-containing protein [Eubacteriales bacterium]|nr:JAB domain-containing protein [bacterium]MDY2793581.1 JAB domain-containing protein [Eubacteriales bacterium]
MTDREALAGMLAFVNRGPEAADEQARALLEKYRTLERVLENSEDLLRGIGGLSSSGALLLSAFPALARRVSAEGLGERPVIARFADLQPLMDALYLGKRQEELYLLSLNRRCELLCARQILKGTLCEVCLSARLVVEAVLETRAELVVLCHNHPAGNPRFSMADVATMRHFLPLMARLGIPVVDHALYAGTRIRSMRAEGRINERVWTATGRGNIPRGSWLG